MYSNTESTLPLNQHAPACQVKITKKFLSKYDLFHCISKHSFENLREKIYRGVFTFSKLTHFLIT